MVMGYFGASSPLLVLASPLSWNMLCHAPDVVGQGTWSRVSIGGPFSAAFANTSSANGDNFSVKARVPNGTYRLRFNALRYASAGIVALELDGVERGRFDLWRSSADNFNIAEITGLQMGGEHTLRFRLVGKNPSSGGHTFRSSEMSLVRTGNPMAAMQPQSTMMTEEVA